MSIPEHGPGSARRARSLIERIDNVTALLSIRTQELVAMLKDHPELTDDVHDIVSEFVRPAIVLKSCKRHLEATLNDEG